MTIYVFAMPVELEFEISAESEDAAKRIIREALKETVSSFADEIPIDLCNPSIRYAPGCEDKAKAVDTIEID